MNNVKFFYVFTKASFDGLVRWVEPENCWCMLHRTGKENDHISIPDTGLQPDETVSTQFYVYVEYKVETYSNSNW